MKLIISLTFISLFFLSPPPAFPQAKTNKKAGIDSSLVLFSFHCPDSFNFTSHYFSPDTLCTNFQKYNPLSKNNQFFAEQGNIGHATRNLIFSPGLYSGFNPGTTAFDSYLYTPGDIRYYRLYRPFTELFYVMGAKKEQVFRVIHTQNLGKSLNLGLNYRIINSIGDYTRQKSDISNFYLTLAYYSKGGKYQAKGAFLNNILTDYENGGIAQDSVFEKNLENNRIIIPVNLQQADNKIRESAFLFSQDVRLFTLGKKQNDSSSRKPTLLRILNNFLPSNFSQSTVISKKKIVYTDLEPAYSFYPSSPVDSTATKDSIRPLFVTNQFFLSNSSDSSNFLHYAIGLRHQYYEIRNREFNDFFRQVTPSLKVQLELPMEFHVKAEGRKTIGDYNDGDYSSSLSLERSFFRQSRHPLLLTVSQGYSREMPSFFMHQYSSNFFNWQVDLYRTTVNKYFIDLKGPDFEIGGELYSINNYTYFLPVTALPAQSSDQINGKHWFLRKKFKFGKLVFDNRIDYQWVYPANKLHLPELITQHSLYLDFELFNGALVAQPGVDIFYVSSYYADSYMPATRSYYLQQDKKINDQILADVFINLKVSRARLFLKYQHFNSYFGKFDYYLVPHYPLQDAGLKFGVSWIFRDPA